MEEEEGEKEEESEEKLDEDLEEGEGKEEKGGTGVDKGLEIGDEREVDEDEVDSSSFFIRFSRIFVTLSILSLSSFREVSFWLAESSGSFSHSGLIKLEKSEEGGGEGGTKEPKNEGDSCVLEAGREDDVEGRVGKWGDMGETGRGEEDEGWGDGRSEG